MFFQTCKIVLIMKIFFDVSNNLLKSLDEMWEYLDLSNL